MADRIAGEIRLAMPALGRALVSSPHAVIDAPKPAALANSEAQQWLNALGGDGQRLETLLPTRQPQKKRGKTLRFLHIVQHKKWNAERPERHSHAGAWERSN
jgi:hypothetical protein